MSEQEIIDHLRSYLIAAVMIGMPLMITALVVGVIVGLFQALTSVQEMTLTFAPKLFVMLIVFWVNAGHMGRVLVTLFNDRVIATIVAGG